MMLLNKISVIFIISSIVVFNSIVAQNVGIGEVNPRAKLSVNGAFSVGTGYSGVYVPPTNGAIIQGQTVVGRNEPLYANDIFTGNGGNGGFAVSGYIYNGIPSSTGATAAINSAALYGFIQGNGGLGLLIDHYSTSNHGAIINTYGASASAALKGDSESSTAHGLMGENPSTGAGYAVYCNGDIYISGGVYGASDAHLKQNIQTYNNGLAAIMALSPKTYFYKPDIADKFRLQTSEQIGFLAQELEDVMPNLVREGRLVSKATTSKNSEKNEAEEIITAKTVNYTALVPVLTSAIQEQQVQIDAQNALIQQQAQVLEKLEAQNKLMKEQLDILMQKAQ